MKILTTFDRDGVLMNEKAEMTVVIKRPRPRRKPGEGISWQTRVFGKFPMRHNWDGYSLEKSSAGEWLRRN